MDTTKNKIYTIYC